METDPGYDMGANHTYRYVKTSGLGIAPLKWTGDTFRATVTRTSTAATGTISSGSFDFLVAWLSSSAYMTICKSTLMNSAAQSSGITQNNSMQNVFDVSVQSGIFGPTSKIITDCKIPTVYQATYGPAGCYPSNNSTIYDITTYRQNNGIYLNNQSDYAFEYWTSTKYYYTNGFTYTEYGFFVSRFGGLSYTSPDSRYQITIFTEIPF